MFLSKQALSSEDENPKWLTGSEVSWKESHLILEMLYLCAADLPFQVTQGNFPGNLLINKPWGRESVCEIELDFCGRSVLQKILLWFPGMWVHLGLCSRCMKCLTHLGGCFCLQSKSSFEDYHVLLLFPWCLHKDDSLKRCVEAFFNFIVVFVWCWKVCFEECPCCLCGDICAFLGRKGKVILLKEHMFPVVSLMSANWMFA